MTQMVHYLRPYTSRRVHDANDTLSAHLLFKRLWRMCQMLNEVDDGVLLVRRGDFMTQTVRYPQSQSL